MTPANRQLEVANFSESGTASSSKFGFKKNVLGLAQQQSHIITAAAVFTLPRSERWTHIVTQQNGWITAVSL